MEVISINQFVYIKSNQEINRIIFDSKQLFSQLFKLFVPFSQRCCERWRHERLEQQSEHNAAKTESLT